MSGSKPARDGARTAPSSGDTRRVHPDAVARAACTQRAPSHGSGNTAEPRRHDGTGAASSIVPPHGTATATNSSTIGCPRPGRFRQDAAYRVSIVIRRRIFIDIVAVRDYVTKTSRPLLSRWSGEAAGCSARTPHPAWLATLEAPMPQVDRQEVLTGAADRLRLAFAKAGGHRQTAAALGIPPRTLSHYVAGTEMPMSALVALSRACGVTLEWLARGAIRCVRAPPRRRSNRRFRSPCRYFFHGGHGAPRARHPRGGGPFSPPPAAPRTPAPSAKRPPSSTTSPLRIR